MSSSQPYIRLADDNVPPAPLRFDPRLSVPHPNGFPLAGLAESADEVLDAFEGMSRRIDDLARELGCLGHYDEDGDDGPRAA